MEKHTGELDDFVVNRLKKLLEFMLFDGDIQRASTISKAVDIIIDQKAEIEALQETIVGCEKEISRQETEIERLRLENKNLFNSYMGFVKKATQDMVDLKGDVTGINNRLKEMVGDGNA